MWESVLKKDKLEIDMDALDKQVAFKVSRPGQEEPVMVQFDQAEMYELLHAFLTISRTFQGDKPYFSD